MKWINKKKRPSQGDTREVIRFAFFPTKTDDGYTVWLEVYKEVWVFGLSMDYDRGGEVIKWYLNKILSRNAKTII